MDLPNPRYPHTPGKTSLAYSPDGKYLFTTGSNMMVRRFVVGDPTSEPDTFEIDGNGMSVATSEREVAIATEDGIAQLYDIGTLEKKCILVRRPLPIRKLQFLGGGEWVAVVGDDTATIVNTKDVERTLRLDSHGGKIRDVNVDASNAYIANSMWDGSIRIDEMNNDTIKDSKHALDALLPTIKDEEDERTTGCAWSPSGDCMAVPNKSFDVVVISSDNWLESFRLVNGHKNAITDIQWSPNGRYIATSGRDHKIMLWEVQTRQVIQQLEGAVGVVALAWHPLSNELSATTNIGQLYTMRDFVKDGLAPPFGPVLPSATIAPSKRRSDSEDVEEDLFVDMDGEGGDGLSSDGLDIESPYQKRQDWSKRPQHRSNSEYIQPYRARSQEAAFQSGSTSWQNGKRYLCTNSEGYVWAVVQDKDHQSVTIQFFNQDKNREVHFQDSEEFNLASLGSDACLFANSRTGKVAMRFHASFTDNWERTFPEGIRSIALSERVAVLCMANGSVRTFSIYGAPLMVSRHVSDVVTCAAFENLVMVVSASQNGYIYCLEDVLNGQYLQKNDSVDVPRSSSLKAVFFTDSGDPCVMDSTGVISTLINAQTPGQARWAPIFDSKEAANENERTFWPLAISGSKFMCVVLKGQQRSPPVPLPLHDEIDLFIPGYCPAPGADASIEGQFLLEKVLYNQYQNRAQQLAESSDEATRELLQQEMESRELQSDKLLLRLFQESCDDNKLNRGMDLALQLRNSESIEAAAKIALYFNLRTLAERISQLAG